MSMSSELGVCVSGPKTIAPEYDSKSVRDDGLLSQGNVRLATCCRGSATSGQRRGNDFNGRLISRNKGISSN